VSAPFTCTELEDHAAELATGVHAGDERARAEAHLADCARCRATVRALAASADDLLALAPAHEPSADFDAAVLARIAPARRSASRARALIAAAVIGVALVGGVAAGRALDRAPRPAEQVTIASLRAGDGEPVGRAFLHEEADATWVLVAVDQLPRTGSYDVSVVLDDGDVRRGTRLDVTDGRGIVAVDVGSPTASVRAVRVTTAEGYGDWYQCEAIF
jgi:hypothetical protein